MTIPPIRADAPVLQPIRQQPPERSALSAAVGAKTLPALSGLLSHSLDVRDLCKTASQQAGTAGCHEPGLPLGAPRQQQLELIVSLLERVPILVGGAVALAEVMSGLPGSNTEPRTAAA